MYPIIGADAPALLDAVQTRSADFMVACRHGLSGFTHWGLGSVAHKLVQQCPVPLLFLPYSERAFAHESSARFARSSPSMAPRSPKQSWMAQFLAGLTQAGCQQGMVLLLQVVGIPASYGRFHSQIASAKLAQAQTEARQRGEQYLTAGAKRLTMGDLAKYHLAVTTRVATNADVAQAITHVAEQELTDVIAMTTHGWGGVLHWALSSMKESHTRTGSGMVVSAVTTRLNESAIVRANCSPHA